MDQDFEVLNELLAHIYEVLENNLVQLKYSIKMDIIDNIILHYRERLPVEVTSIIHNYLMLIKLSQIQAEREPNVPEEPVKKLRKKTKVNWVNFQPEAERRIKRKGKPRQIKSIPNIDSLKKPEKEAIKSKTVSSEKPKPLVQKFDSPFTIEFRNLIFELATIEHLLTLTDDKSDLQDSREILQSKLIKIILGDRNISELSNQQIAYSLYLCFKPISKDNKTIETFNRIDWSFLLNDFKNLRLNIPRDENGQIYMDGNIIQPLVHLRNYQRVPPYQSIRFQKEVKKLVEEITGIDFNKHTQDERAHIIVRLGSALQFHHEQLIRAGHTKTEHKFDLIFLQINWDFLVESIES